MNEPQAANPPAAADAGQAASAQQGAPQPAQAGVQGGQAPTGQGPQGATPATGQQAEHAPNAGTPADEAPPAEYQLRLPEQTPLDQTDVAFVAAMAKDKGWSQEAAQAALTEMHTQLHQQRETLRAELVADPEVGGTKLEQAQQLALRVLDRFLPDREVLGQRFRRDINRSGHGNYLPLVTLLARIGQAMSEDRPGTGATGHVFSPPSRSQADRLFGDAQGVREAKP